MPPFCRPIHRSWFTRVGHSLLDLDILTHRWATPLHAQVINHFGSEETRGPKGVLAQLVNWHLTSHYNDSLLVQQQHYTTLSVFHFKPKDCWNPKTICTVCKIVVSFQECIMLIPTGYFWQIGLNRLVGFVRWLSLCMNKRSSGSNL